MPVLDAENLVKLYPVRTGGFFGQRKAFLRAVDGVSLSIERGETLGLVGESGSGKSTVGMLCLGLLEKTSGTIRFLGRPIEDYAARDALLFRRKAQIVFQNPFASLNPRMIVRNVIGRVLEIHGLATGADVGDRVGALLREVGLREDQMTRYPHEFSGGQRQRIAVARALAPDPELVVLDEPTSALDVSVQAQILNLLRDIQAARGLAYLFISHNLAVIRHASHRVAVMYLGRLVETARKDHLFARPLHPYTKALLASVPKPFVTGDDIEDAVISGDIPSPLRPPSGCRFHTRCACPVDRCSTEEPTWREVEPGHCVACHRVGDIP
jgi:oligopeptide/dipeptide ABC transporter ATP-binding protein